ncbi:MAG: hypothetical protein PVTTEEND_002090, partial [Candidatus Fervidibacter sp.]
MPVHEGQVLTVLMLEAPTIPKDGETPWVTPLGEADAPSIARTIAIGLVSGFSGKKRDRWLINFGQGDGTRRDARWHRDADADEGVIAHVPHAGGWAVVNLRVFDVSPEAAVKVSTRTDIRLPDIAQPVDAHRGAREKDGQSLVVILGILLQGERNLAGVAQARDLPRFLPNLAEHREQDGGEGRGKPDHPQQLKKGGGTEERAAATGTAVV